MYIISFFSPVITPVTASTSVPITSVWRAGAGRSADTTHGGTTGNSARRTAEHGQLCTATWRKCQLQVCFGVYFLIIFFIQPPHGREDLYIRFTPVYIIYIIV